MTSGIHHREMRRGIFDQIAGDEIVKAIGAEDRERRGKILLQDFQQPIKIHVRINIHALDGAEAIIRRNDLRQPAAIERSLIREALGDTRRSCDEPIEQALKRLKIVRRWHWYAILVRRFDQSSAPCWRSP